MPKVTKIRAASSTDDKLVKECEKKTNCGDCNPTITWTTPSNKPTTPPEDTVVIIVDVRSSRGAVRIFKQSGDDASSDEYLDGIGTEQAGKLVIVPWDSGWYFSAAGSLPVGYVTRRVRDEEAQGSLGA